VTYGYFAASVQNAARSAVVVMVFIWAFSCGLRRGHPRVDAH
jgi:hypothetical protein